MIWNNIKTFHHRIFANYLRKRGWVVFYLDNYARTCNMVCWLSAYEYERTQNINKKISNDNR